MAGARLRPGWEICVETEPETGAFWLRLPAEDAAAAAALPCLARYEAGEDGRLVPPGRRLPVGVMPEGPWVPLGDWITVSGFPVLLPGLNPARMEISLARAAVEAPAEAWLGPLETLLAWAEGASRLRMERLKFAAAADGRVLVRGTPLPPVPGSVWYFRGALGFPCGLEPAPPLLPEWIESSLGLSRGSTALWSGEGGFEVIPGESWVPLSLAALRRTAAAALTRF